MIAALSEVCFASLPVAALASLADLRCHSGVRAAIVGQVAWIRWELGDEQVLQRLLPISGVELYGEQDGLWYRFGRHLASFGLPTGIRMERLDRVLLPAPIETLTSASFHAQPVAVRLVRDDQPRKAAAMLCLTTELSEWADQAPSARLAALDAALCESTVLLVGKRLPPLASGQRFWGRNVLLPLGHRLEPSLSDSDWLAALGGAEGEFVVYRADAAEIVARDALQPLTRAGIRLALRKPS